MQFSKILNIFALFNFISAQNGGFQKTALTKMNKYYNFVDPFLTIFIHPKENGKMMKMKIESLENKFERWTGRFVKFYERCGIEGTEGNSEGGRRRRRETPAERRESRREFRKNRKQNKFKEGELNVRCSLKARCSPK